MQPPNLPAIIAVAQARGIVAACCVLGHISFLEFNGGKHR